MKAMLKTAGPRPGSPAPTAGGPPQPQQVPQQQPAVTPPMPTPAPQAARTPTPPPAQVPQPASVPQAASVPAPASAVPPTPAPNPPAVMQTQAPAPEPTPQPVQAQPVPTAAVTVVETQIVTPEDRMEDRQLATANMFGGRGGMEGDWDKNNLILPRFQIVQGNGQLSTRFPGGTAIVSDETFLSPPNAQSPAVPVNFVPIELKKQFRERVEQNSGLKPRIAFSKAEVRSLGGETEWVNNVRPSWDETARAIMLVQQPGGIDHPAFSEIEGLPGKFAVLVYYAFGVSFKHFGEVLATAAASTLRVPTNVPGQSMPYLPKRWWRLTVEPRPWGRFNPYCGIAKQTTAETDDVTRAVCNGYMNRNVQDDE